MKALDDDEITALLAAKPRRGRPAHPVTLRIRFVLDQLRAAGLHIRVKEVQLEVERITPFSEYPDYKELLGSWLRGKVRGELSRKTKDGVRLYVSWADKLGIARSYIPIEQANAAILGRHGTLDRQQAKALVEAAKHYEKLVHAFERLGPEATVEEAWEEAFDDEALAKVLASYPSANGAATE